jgi:hypothetical protein
MSLAADTREAVRERPFLLEALRAGVVNYAAAAQFLDLDGDRDAVAAALRRFAADLPDHETTDRDVTVRMRRGVDLVEDAAVGDGPPADGGVDAPGREDDEPELVVTAGERAYVAGGGQMTAVLAEGDVDAAAMAAVLGRLRADDVVVDAAGLVDDRLVVVVPSREGAAALRIVEESLGAVPT